MTAYRAIFSARFRTLLQYRAAAMAGVVTQVFWGLIRVMIFAGFYASTIAAQPMSYTDVVTYIWLGQATVLLVFFRADGEVEGMIRSGAVAYELARPVDLHGLWFSRSVAARTAPLFLRMIPIYVIAGLFLGLRPPQSARCGVLFLLTTGGAILLSAAVATTMTASVFWTVSGQGMNRLISMLFYFLSGIMVPIPLFPDWAQPLLRLLPFRGVADTPFRVYLGHIAPDQALGALAHQLAWTAVFLLIGRWLVARGTRRLVVQGG